MEKIPLKIHSRLQISGFKVILLVLTSNYAEYKEYEKLWVSAVHDMPKPAKVRAQTQTQQNTAYLSSLTNSQKIARYNLFIVLCNQGVWKIW